MKSWVLEPIYIAFNFWKLFYVSNAFFLTGGLNEIKV